VWGKERGTKHSTSGKGEELRREILSRKESVKKSFGGKKEGKKGKREKLKDMHGEDERKMCAFGKGARYNDHDSNQGGRERGFNIIERTVKISVKHGKVYEDTIQSTRGTKRSRTTRINIK